MHESENSGAVTWRFEYHCYQISSLKDREMKNEKQGIELVKGHIAENKAVAEG